MKLQVQMGFISRLVTPTVLVLLATKMILVLLSSHSVFYDNEEDFRRTACTSLLQHVVETSRWRRDGAEGEEQKAKNSVSDGNRCKIN